MSNTILSPTLQSIEEILISLIKSIDISELKKSISGIIAIGRGGFIPATYLSYGLNIPIVSAPILRSYKGSYQLHTSPKVDIPTYGLDKDKSYLIVDDIIDSGNTLNYLLDYNLGYRNLVVCVLYAKGDFTKKLNPYLQKAKFFTGKNLSDDVWVDFPWEVH